MTPWMKGVPPLAHFMPGNDDFTLKPWLVKPLQQLTWEERLVNVMICRCRSIVENMSGMIVSRFTRDIKAKAKAGQ